jgi:hypothetical protein
LTDTSLLFQVVAEFDAALQQRKAAEAEKLERALQAERRRFERQLAKLRSARASTPVSVQTRFLSAGEGGSEMERMTGETNRSQGQTGRLFLEPSKTSGEKGSDDEDAQIGDDAGGKRVKDRDGESLKGLGRISASGNVVDQQERKSQALDDDEWVSGSNFEFDSGQRTVENFTRRSDSCVGTPGQPLLEAEASPMREESAQKTEADLVACQEKCRQLEETIAALQGERSTSEIELSRCLELSERHVAEAQARAEAAEAKIAVLVERASLLSQREHADVAASGVDTWTEETKGEEKEEGHDKVEEEARDRRRAEEGTLEEDREKVRAREERHALELQEVRLSFAQISSLALLLSLNLLPCPLEGVSNL